MKCCAPYDSKNNKETIKYFAKCDDEMNLVMLNKIRKFNENIN